MTVTVETVDLNEVRSRMLALQQQRKALAGPKKSAQDEFDEIRGKDDTLSTRSHQVAQEAMEYSGYDWHVVPLYGVRVDGTCECKKGSKCRSAGKHPRIASWQTEASSNEEIIAGWLERWPLANIGVLLGQRSGIIDVECDTPEAEKTLASIFGGEIPIVPVFQSSRGRHRLFKWQPGLPGGATLPIDGIDFKLGNGDKGSQSVFPPSKHHTGIQYKWLISPSECEPVELPDTVIARIANWDGGDVDAGKTRRSQGHWNRITAGVPEGSRRNDMASYIGKMLYSVSDLDDTVAVNLLFESALAVNSRNQPPMEEAEVKALFADLLAKEQHGRSELATEQILGPVPKNPPKDKTKPGDFRLVIVQSNPPGYELHAPQFCKAKGGYLVLTAEQMMSPRAIRIQALKQAEYPLPTTFTQGWDKKGGMLERLVLEAETKIASLEQRRDLVIAEYLHEELIRAQLLEGSAELDTKGRPQRLDDGSVLFKFYAVWEWMHDGPDKVKRQELTNLLTELNVVDCTKKVGGRNQRFKVLRRDALRSLEEMIGLAQKSPEPQTPGASDSFIESSEENEVEASQQQELAGL